MTLQALAVDREALAGLCRQVGLDLLLLYGSQASGQVHPESDVDLGYVRRSKPLGRDEWLELLERARPYVPAGEIDLVDLQRVPGLLRHLACERGILLFESGPEEFERFRILAWNLHQDERLQLRRYDSEGLRRAIEALRA